MIALIFLAVNLLAALFKSKSIVAFFLDASDFVRSWRRWVRRDWSRLNLKGLPDLFSSRIYHKSIRGLCAKYPIQPLGARLTGSARSDTLSGVEVERAIIHARRSAAVPR